jgi:hypothetical protein
VLVELKQNSVLLATLPEKSEVARCLENIRATMSTDNDEILTGSSLQHHQYRRRRSLHAKSRVALSNARMKLEHGCPENPAKRPEETRKASTTMVSQTIVPQAKYIKK